MRIGVQWSTGSGAAKVASRARIRPTLRERSPTPKPQVHSAPPARGRQKSRRGRGYAPMLRERSPTPKPQVHSAAPARGRQKSRRGRGYAPMLRERSPTPEPQVHSAAPARGRQKSRRGRGYAPCSVSVRRPPSLPRSIYQVVAPPLRNPLERLGMLGPADGACDPGLAATRNQL